jgi:formyl-CoA transferase
MNIPAFFRAIGRPELLERAADDQFMATELQPILEKWCAERTRQEVYAVAVEFGAPLSYVATPDDLLDSEVVDKTGIWREVEHPIAGSFRTPGPPFRAQASEFSLRRAPLLGEHTGQVLRARTSLSDGDVRTLVGQAALSRQSGVA